ncbi:hypothetical protein [Roseobacter ponti]|uniref:Cytochrome c domain-containing protein n=1 Tax=Roseobacter ponti TaxID=1891787 RepID=A0A858SS87_9RHOB|nr:hypothetical protein [Roseobacter ponti]QJF51759.1 hypothetical protein G3256_11595 [Roseobacter ponti]
MRGLIAAVLIWHLAALPPAAQDGPLRLAVPEALDASGFAQHLLPRFSLKTGVRITRVSPGAAAEMAFGEEGRPVFEGPAQRWSFSHGGDPRAERFLEWLQSDVGKRTIESYTGPDGESYTANLTKARVEEETVYEGDALAGEKLSLLHCGRCHVINKKNRMNGLGSTPSFAVLRGLPEWDTRFATFHLLNPHPSFTQIKDVTAPFDPTLPPPIVPVEITLPDLEAILAFVSEMAPADLGAPLQLQ